MNRTAPSTTTRRRSRFLLLGLAGCACAALASTTGCSESSATSSLDAAPADATAEATTGDAGTVAPSDAAASFTDSAATVVVTGAGAVTAPPTAYGQNYWCWVSSYGDQVNQVQDGAAGLHVRLLRAGGHNNDNNTPQAFTTDQVDLLVAYARAIGAEPILQVPLLLDVNGARPTPQTAADMVTYANVTKKYGIKYWEIGNEPDLYSDQGDLPGYTPANDCADFGAFADAMRAVDPTIRIIGPDLSYKYVPGNDWLTPFLSGCADKVDVVAVHRYPFSAAQSTIAAAMGDPPQFRATVRALRQTLDALGLAAKPLAITEANLSYQGDPALQTADAPLGSFYAGMWVADTAGIALEEGVWSLAFWSIDEGFLTGFFTSDTFAPRPAAYAYELLSTHFGPTILQATTVPATLSAHASRDDAAKKTIVLLINRNNVATSAVVGFTGLAVSPPNVAVPLPAYSLALVELPDGVAPATWLYTQDMANLGLGPQRQ